MNSAHHPQPTIDTEQKASSCEEAFFVFNTAGVTLPRAIVLGFLYPLIFANLRECIREISGLYIKVRL